MSCLFSLWDNIDHSTVCVLGEEGNTSLHLCYNTIPTFKTPSILYSRPLHPLSPSSFPLQKPQLCSHISKFLFSFLACFILFFYRSEISQYLCFFFWLTSLSIVTSSSIQPCCCRWQEFIFICNKVVFKYMCMPYLCNPLICPWALGLFPLICHCK